MTLNPLPAIDGLIVNAREDGPPIAQLGWWLSALDGLSELCSKQQDSRATQDATERKSTACGIAEI